VTAPNPAPALVAARGFLKFTDLPFVRSEKGGRNYWHIDCPAGYSDGCNFGEDAALLALLVGPSPGYLADTLRSIALAQVKHPPKTDGQRGALLGFWSVITDFVAETATIQNVLAARAGCVAERQAYRARLEANEQKRVENARRAAKIGAEKRRARKSGRAKA
jgi:hypothetical protein